MQSTAFLVYTFWPLCAGLHAVPPSAPRAVCSTEEAPSHELPRANTLPTAPPGALITLPLCIVVRSSVDAPVSPLLFALLRFARDQGTFNLAPVATEP
eukprot:COSAG02_NODE_31345_length_535_cov_0.853211_1_plen_97_part_01